MKTKFSVLVISIFLLSIYSFAQNEDFEVKVFPQNINSDNDKSIALIVTRKIGADFDTKQRISIWFYLLRCPKKENCNTVDDEYLAVSSVKGKKLAKTETLGLRMNVAEFYWTPTMSSIDVINPSPNFSKVPKENKYFHAELRVCEKPGTEQKKATVVCTSYLSNEIVLSLKP